MQYLFVRSLWIDHGQERKTSEISVQGADSTDAMFAHQHSGMQVVHHIPAKIREFGQGLLKHRCMTEVATSNSNPGDASKVDSSRPASRAPHGD